MKYIDIDEIPTKLKKIDSVADCTNKYKNLVQSACLTYDKGSGNI